MDEKGNQYNIKDYVENLGWEQGEDELSTRISFTTKNEKSSKEVFSDIAKLGCLVGIFASDGVTDEEVARGNIIDWKPAYSSDAYKFDGKCYDNLYNLQESQDNIYYPAGTGTKSAVTKIFDDWEIPLGSYEGPNETHAKLTFKSQDLANVIAEILDDAYKKGGVKCVVQDRKGKAYVVPYANNKTVYHFAAENVINATHKRSTAGMITRVKVIGQEDDDGKSSVESVLNGSTKYGVRQKIVRRGTDESLEDAKTSAGDLVHVTVGTMNAYYYVIGIRHDVDSHSMTLDLHVPFKEYEKKAQQTVQKKSYNVGDIVNFHGGTHYVSSYAGSRGYNARAGRAKITIKNGSGKIHPWHLIHVDSSSNVYGWVDDGTFD